MRRTGLGCLLFGGYVSLLGLLLVLCRGHMTPGTWMCPESRLGTETDGRLTTDTSRHMPSRYPGRYVPTTLYSGLTALNRDRSVVRVASCWSMPRGC